jgi:hypothetical protein
MKLVSEPSWVTVFQSTDEFEIRIKKLQLEDEGIPVSIFDQRDSSYNAFGYIYLNVPKDYEEVASNLVNLSDE